MEQVIFFDTTCRDGKQAPGNNHGVAETLRIAHQAARLGINVFEAGFAISSDDDFDCIRKVASEVSGIVPCSLARAAKGDITAAARALEKAIVSPRIHTFIGTSPTHREKLGKNQDQVLEDAVRAVELARTYVDDVEFSAEDAMRTEFEYLVRIISAAINAGAMTVNIPDTVGYRLPQEIATTIRNLIEAVPAIRNKSVIVSVHCHNDLECATANTLAGIEAGARQVECTVNGIGERAGNTHYASVAMALTTRKDYFDLTHTINTPLIGMSARLVSGIVKKPIPDNQPIVGESVFAHGSGIHQHGMRKNKETYEIMRPEDVGWTGVGTQLSSQSGRSGLQERLELFGYEVGGNGLRAVYQHFLRVASLKPLVSNDDLHMIMQIYNSESLPKANVIMLSNVSYQSFDAQHIEATATLVVDDITRRGTADSDRGPVDAVWRALQSALSHVDTGEFDSIKLSRYEMGKGSGSTNAMAHTYVALTRKDEAGLGYAENPDIVRASAESLVMAVNHLINISISVGQIDL